MMGKKSRTTANNDHIYIHILQIKQIKRILCDASSLIYLDKLQLLNLISNNLSLFTISEIVTEIGPDCQSHATLSIVAPLTQNHGYGSLIPDRKLVLQAVSTKMPVLSDDGRIIQAGLSQGFAVYQVIYMILWLHFNDLVNQSVYWEARGQLKDFARYSPALLAQADQLLFMFGKYF